MSSHHRQKGIDFSLQWQKLYIPCIKGITNECIWWYGSIYNIHDWLRWKILNILRAIQLRIIINNIKILRILIMLNQIVWYEWYILMWHLSCHSFLQDDVMQIELNTDIRSGQMTMQIILIIFDLTIVFMS